MSILQATIADIPALEMLLNSAYRGEDSKKGWTSEADLLEGEIRTDANTLSNLLESPEAVFLKSVDDAGRIEGCVFLQVVNKKLYLGMLSVSPLIQAKGIGGLLMAEAERHAQRKKCNAVFMKVISLRTELIAWYERKGYRETGEREPFPGDRRFGVPTRDLEFVIMEKKM